MSQFNLPTTLNNIIGMFGTIAAEHKQINSFGYGPDFDINVDSPVMPLMYVVPIDSVIHTHTIDLRYDVYVVDLVNKDDSNRNDVHSDSYQTLLDINAFLQKNLIWDSINVNKDADIIPLWEKFDDELVGHKMRLKVQLEWDGNVCDIPGMYPSGGTFTFGGGDGGIIVTGYLPLTGGILSGPLSGTSADFNEYFINGVNIYDIFSTGSTSAGAFLPLTGGTVTGNTSFIGNLSATTLYGDGSHLTGISTIDTYVTGFTFNNSTYDLTIKQNEGQPDEIVNLAILATDMTITGGTYNNATGTATFTNNTGGTFNVTGFVTGFTDIYTTGFTYSNNVFTIRRNDNTNLTILANVMSGLTINGILSATTYQGLPNDIYVSGGTYSNGTAIFTNTSGGTFNVNGFFTGSTDIHTTGFTYNNNQFVITDNIAGTYTATINTMTGLTVNGNLVSNTLSATSLTANSITYIDGNQFLDTVLMSDSNGNATWKMPKLVGSLTYFYTNIVGLTSGSTNYYNGYTTYQNGANQTIINTSVADTALLAVFITPSGGTGYNFFPSGIANIYINAAATGKTTQLYFEIYNRTSSGVESLLGTSNYTTALSSATTLHTCGVFIEAYSANTTDRVVTKVYAHTSGVGSNPNITINLASNTFTRVEIPAITTDTSNFVPYTGATSNINLGTHSLTTTGNITAFTYFGDGSNLTGISGGTDNYVTGGTFNYNTQTLQLKRQNGNVNITGFQDVYISGGTYNTATGIATFNNTSGSTFSITGFTTGTTDSYVTGVTYNTGTNILTLNRNNGLSALTTSIPDIHVTGLTFTSSVLTLTQNAGGPTLTVTIDGSSLTGTTDTFVTGFTYTTGGTLSILQNQGKTPLTVSIQNTGAIVGVINGAGTTINTGQKAGYLTIPYNGFITGWDIFSSDGITGVAITGNCIVDVWKTTYANFPPTSGNTIFITNKPTLTNQSKNTFTGLAIPISIGDVIGFDVTSASTVTLVNVILKTLKS